MATIKQYWLDDIREPPEGWVWIKTAANAIYLLERHEFHNTSSQTVWSFDHDLGEADVATGYDVAKWIEEKVHTTYSYNPPKILIHTANPVGRANIQRCVDSIGRALLERNT